MGLTLRGATALCTTIFFLVPGAAFAQAAYDWTGPYVGATLGVVRSDGSASIIDGPEFQFSTNGALAGLTAGYNVQVDKFVIGIEADGSFVTLDGESDGYFMPFGGAEERLESMLTLRGRLGVTNGPVLAYGTLGLVGGQASYVVDDGYGTAEGSGFTTGIIGGAGVEVAVNDNISVKTEGLMYRMSPLSATSDTGKGDEFNSEYNPSGLVVRTGINFHF